MDNELKTNHNVRVLKLTTGDTVLCIFGEVTNPQNSSELIGYKMVYPQILSLGEPKEDGSVPVKYTRWCPFSPMEEYRLNGEHIINAVYPDNNILSKFVEKLGEFGITEEQIFYTEKPTEETDNGDSSEPVETAE